MRWRGLGAAAPAVDGGFHRDGWVAVTFAGKLEVNGAYGFLCWAAMVDNIEGEKENCDGGGSPT